MANAGDPKKEDLSEELTRQGMLGGDDVNRSIASQLGIPIVTDFSLIPFPKHLYQEVPYAFVRKNLALPIQEENGFVLVAVADPLDLEPLEELRHMLKKEVKAVYSPRETILLAIDACYQEHGGAASQLIAHLAGERGGRDEQEIEVYDLLDTSKSQAPVIKLINLIITEAIQQDASDIHFDPSESGLKVRYRIDGVLQVRHSPALEYQAQLLTRLKVMAKLDIAERRLPQDGRIKLKMGAREIDFRVSTVPVIDGERIVLRILDKGSISLGLDQLGMMPKVYNEFRKLITLPEGIILVTGPTGSGKTTTLYSAICDICSDEVNIMTIEDPVEYNLKGIAQIGVHSKIDLTFATGLRHILRQDPDIIMIGEIRDKETAEIAIQSSLTGHLVLSTLHTNDAPSAITRLVDMGIEPYLLSSTIVGIMAQRLVRRICAHCKEKYRPTDEELISVGIQRSELTDGMLCHGKGCSVCFDSGYKGRHGLYELLVVNNAIRKQMVKSPDAVELRILSLKEGMSGLLVHGKKLIIDGVTTVTEVLRVSKGVEE